MFVTQVLTSNCDEKVKMDTWSKQTQTKPILLASGGFPCRLTLASQLPAPGNQAVYSQSQKEYIKEHNEFYVPRVIQADTNNIDANPQTPAFDFSLGRKCRCDKPHHRGGRVDIGISGGLRKKQRQINVNPAHHKSQKCPPCRYYQDGFEPGFACGVRYLQFFLFTFDFFPGDKPAMPAVETVADIIKLLEKIRIKTDLVEQDGKKCESNYPQRPRPNDSSGNQQDINSNQKGSRKLDVTHRIAEKGKKYVMDVKNTHKKKKIWHKKTTVRNLTHGGF
jgi:hypothetical protein